MDDSCAIFGSELDSDHSRKIELATSSPKFTIEKEQNNFLRILIYVWGGAPNSSLHLLDRVQSKAIRLINNSNLTISLQSLSHYRLVSDLSIFYCYFHGHCSQEIKNIMPDPVRHVRTTRISTYSQPFQVTLPNPRTLSHKSSFIPRTSQLWNSLPLLSLNPTICHLLNLNINKLDLVSLPA